MLRQGQPHTECVQPVSFVLKRSVEEQPKQAPQDSKRPPPPRPPPARVGARRDILATTQVAGTTKLRAAPYSLFDGLAQPTVLRNGQSDPPPTPPPGRSILTPMYTAVVYMTYYLFLYQRYFALTRRTRMTVVRLYMCLPLKKRWARDVIPILILFLCCVVPSSEKKCCSRLGLYMSRQALARSTSTVFFFPVSRLQDSAACCCYRTINTVCCVCVFLFSFVVAVQQYSSGGLFRRLHTQFIVRQESCLAAPVLVLVCIASFFLGPVLSEQQHIRRSR